MSFDKKVNLTKYAEDFAVKAEEAAKEKEAAAKAESDAKLLQDQEMKQRELDAKKGIFVGRQEMPDVIVINNDKNDSSEIFNFNNVIPVLCATVYLLGTKLFFGIE
jgi:hypothetical protein